MSKCVVLLAVCAMAAMLDGQILGGPTHGKTVVCYVAEWAVHRPSLGQSTLEEMDLTLCTHVIYSFAGLDTTNVIKSLDPWQDLEENNGKAGYKRLVGMKQRYPHLKVSIAIGGWNDGSLKYSDMASKAESRAVFVESVLMFLKQHEFDGLDLHWKFPTARDGKPYDKHNFVLLVKELKEAFEPHNYILTAALGAGKDTMEPAYDLPKLGRYLDFLHMLCYDYHGSWGSTVGANAPMHGIDDDDVFSVEYTIKYVISQGVSPDKLVLGLPLFGRTFILTNPNVRDIVFGKTPVKGSGFRGPYTSEDGFMGYNEICAERNSKSSSWSYYWDERSQTPYLRDGERIVSYDDSRSIAIKVKSAIEHGLGGVMVWSIDTDDFRGGCAREEDAYIDFIQRHAQLLDNPLLHKALKTLNLPDASRVGKLSNSVSYVMSDGKLTLRLPNFPKTNFNLMRTINEAASLALEEKRITDEMDRVARENEIADKCGNGVSSVGGSAFCVILCLLLVNKCV